MNAAIICNPNAGKRNRDAEIESAKRVLEGEGWSMSLHLTTARGDATILAQSAIERGLDAVLVAGGDGTLNEAVQALAHTDTALGYLPYGTVNIWAREMSIPLDAEGAARAIAHGRTERIDLGMAGDRYFLLMASLGFDAEVLRRAQGYEHHKRRFGILPYIAITAASMPMYRGADFELRYDGIIRRFEAHMLVVGNTRLYGGYFSLTPNAVANDGWLDVCVVKGRGPLSMARQTIPILLSRSVSHSDVELLRVKNVTIQSSVPVPLQVDGELLETTPTRFGVAPRALNVIVPHGFTSTLIA